jgi:hypothetical protein
VLTMMEPDDDRAGVVTPVVNKKKTAEDGDAGKKKKRKVHTLPLKLASLTGRNHGKFDLALEVDKTHRSAAFGQEFLVANPVFIPSTNGNVNDPAVLDLSSVFANNLRKLCTNLGILNVGSLLKFNCRKAIAIYFWYQESLVNIGIRPTSHASRITSSAALSMLFSVLTSLKISRRLMIATSCDRTTRPKTPTKLFGFVPLLHILHVWKQWRMKQRLFWWRKPPCLQETVRLLQTVLFYFPEGTKMMTIMTLDPIHPGVVVVEVRLRVESCRIRCTHCTYPL